MADADGATVRANCWLKVFKHSGNYYKNNALLNAILWMEKLRLGRQRKVLFIS